MVAPSSSPSRGGARRPPEWIDRLLGSDPGLNRLRLAAQATLTIALAMLVERAFVGLTHALQLPEPPGLPAAQQAQLEAQHHGVLVIAIMIGALMGMMASFAASMFPRKRVQLLALVLMPVPMVAGLALGLALADHRAWALVSFAVVLGAGGYLRRFGPWGFFGGQLVFIGDFFGFFLAGAVGPGDLGWLAAEIFLGVAVAVLIQFTVFFPGRRPALRRTRRAFGALLHRVGSAALDVVDEPGDARRSRRLHRLLIRLNESALMVDAQLADPAALPEGSSAAAIHQRLFDLELAVTDLARFAERIAGLPKSRHLRDLVRSALTGVVASDPTRVAASGRAMLEAARVENALDDTQRIIVHRFAESALAYAATMQGRDPRTDAAPETDPTDEFTPSVELVGGYLPGSAMVSGEASTTPGSVLIDRVTLPPYGRVAIQLTVAVSASMLLGSLLSERRFYWAVIATFVTFMGAHHAAEQMRKGMLRVLGTLVGVVLGALAAHLTGTSLPASIAVILCALFLGLYLMRVSYLFMVTGITVMVSELYVQLDEFSDSLLLLRLEETAVGAAVAILTVLLVVPLRTRHVARLAVHNYLLAVDALVQAAVDALTSRAPATVLRAAARRLDAEYQTLVAVLRPLRSPLPLTANGPRRQLLQSAAASRNYGRNLLVDAHAAGPLDPEQHALLVEAGDRLRRSLGSLVDRLGPGHDLEEPYVRAASLFSRVAAGLTDPDVTAVTSRPQLALRDLQLLDGALVTFAELARMPVLALDEGPRPPAPAVPGQPVVTCSGRPASATG